MRGQTQFCCSRRLKEEWREVSILPKKKGKIARTSDPRAGSSRGGKGRELLNQFWQGNGGSRRWTSTKETVREKRKRRESRNFFFPSMLPACPGILFWFCNTYIYFNPLCLSSIFLFRLYRTITVFPVFFFFLNLISRIVNFFFCTK